jgi:hypothetical protein
MAQQGAIGAIHFAAMQLVDWLQTRYHPSFCTLCLRVRRAARQAPTFDNCIGSKEQKWNLHISINHANH